MSRTDFFSIAAPAEIEKIHVRLACHINTGSISIPGVIPTMLPPPPIAAPGVMPTIEPPDWPSISTTSPVSNASGDILFESPANSHLPSLPATDHGRGLGGNNGVLITPLPFLIILLSTSKLLIDSLLGERILLLSCAYNGGCKRSPPLLLWYSSDDTSVFCFLTSGDFRPTNGEYFSKLSDDRDRGVQATPFSNGELRSNLIGLRSSSIGVVSSDVKQFLPFSSRLIVGLSTKLNELHSSDVGDTNGVSVLGVTEPGRKNASMPSPMLCVDNSVTSGRLGARVFMRFGRPLTRCCSCSDVLGSSVIESQFSQSSFCSCEPDELLREFGDSRRSGMWLRLRFSTTDCGRTLWANERRFGCKCGVACEAEIHRNSINIGSQRWWSLVMLRNFHYSQEINLQKKKSYLCGKMHETVYGYCSVLICVG